MTKRDELVELRERAAGACVKRVAERRLLWETVLVDLAQAYVRTRTRAQLREIVGEPAPVKGKRAPKVAVAASGGDEIREDEP